MSYFAKKKKPRRPKTNHGNRARCMKLHCPSAASPTPCSPSAQHCHCQYAMDTCPVTPWAAARRLPAPPLQHWSISPLEPGGGPKLCLQKKKTGGWCRMPSPFSGFQGVGGRRPSGQVGQVSLLRVVLVVQRGALVYFLLPFPLLILFLIVLCITFAFQPVRAETYYTLYLGPRIVYVL